MEINLASRAESMASIVFPEGDSVFTKTLKIAFSSMCFMVGASMFIEKSDHPKDRAKIIKNIGMGSFALGISVMLIEKAAGYISKRSSS